MVKMNWDEVKSGRRKILPGTYNCIVTGIAKVPWRDTLERWDLEFLICDGDFEGKVIRDKLYFSAEAAWRVKWLFASVGKELKGHAEARPEDLLNKGVRVTVEDDVYEGKDGTEKTALKVVAFDKIESASTAKKGEQVIKKSEIPEDDIPF